MIYIVVYITENCTACARVVASAQNIVDKFSTTKLKVKNISELNTKCQIAPAVFINDRLFCYGEFDKRKLIEQITILYCPH